MAGVDIHSVQFPGFLTLSRCLFFSLPASFFGCVEKPLQVVPTTPSTLPSSFYTHTHTHTHTHMRFFFFFQPSSLPSPSPISIAHSHLSVSTSNAWSATNVQRLTVCFQPPCHHLIPLLSVYSGICVRKYILGWLIPPRLISAAE